MFTDFKNPFTVGLCNKFSERYLLLVVGPMPKTHHAGNFGRCLLGAVDSILASHGRDRQTDRLTAIDKNCHSIEEDFAKTAKTRCDGAHPLLEL